MGLSVKKIKHFIEEEKDRQIYNYLLRFLPKNFDKRELDKYVRELMNAEVISKKDIKKRLEAMR